MNSQTEWSDAALLATAAEFPGVGSDSEFAPLDRFRFGISYLVGKSLARLSPGGDATDDLTPKLAIFLLHPPGPPENLAKRCTRVPMLDQGRAPLVGRVWFVTQVVAHGTWFAPSFADDEELFRCVTDDLALGNVPTAVYDAREGEPELRIYPKGLADLDMYEQLYIAFTHVSVSDILEGISAICATQLVTPGAQHRATRLWSNASLGQVASNAEDVLGGLLAAGLQGAYLSCKVRVEQPQPTGRLDIAIEEPVLGQAGTTRVHAVLELKILRGVNQRGKSVSARTVRTWVESGVNQAAAYRSDRNALAAALCCFDMRSEFTGEQCFAHVASLAARMDVSLAVWHLFSSSAAYRKHLSATGALSREPSGGPA
ncbi:MAG: hypothetical protein ACRDLE_05385 [Gaiellaceae bacterium]